MSTHLGALHLDELSQLVDGELLRELVEHAHLSLLRGVGNGQLQAPHLQANRTEPNPPPVVRLRESLRLGQPVCATTIGSSPPVHCQDSYYAKRDESPKTQLRLARRRQGQGILAGRAGSTPVSAHGTTPPRREEPGV